MPAKDIVQSGWTPGGNPVIDMMVLNAIPDVGDVRELTEELQALENPHAMRVAGQAALIVSGEEIAVDQGDPHEFYAQFYTRKAKEALENGDQAAAQKLNAQAKQHNTIIGGDQGMGAGSPESIQEEGAVAPPPEA